MGNSVFDLPDGSREIVRTGGDRYFELVADGYTPLEGPVLPLPDPYPQYATLADVAADYPNADVAVRHAPAFGMFFPEAEGAVGDGAADDSAAVQAAIDAAHAAGGGTVTFGPRTYRIDATLTLPNDGATVPKQSPVRLTGAGSRWDGKWQNNGTPPGCTILDLRSTTGPAKIDTRGLGLLTLERLVLTQNGSAADTNPFVHTTNTTLMAREVSVYGHSTLSGTACAQDAFILGGATSESDGTAAAMFQGYGSAIEDCYFARIRRGVFGRAACNSVRVHGNTWSHTCGSDASAAAVQFDGTVDQSTGNVVTDNIIEVTGYVHAIKLTNSGRNYCAGNAFWDENGTMLACYYLEGSNTKTSTNYLHGIFTSIAQEQKWVVDATTGGSTYTLFANGEFMPQRLASQQTTVQPYLPTGSESATLLGVKRSGSEAANPSAYVHSFRQDGAQFTGGSWSSVAKHVIQNGSATTTHDHTSVVKNTGHLDLYAGSGATDMVRLQRGPLQLPRYTTAARPAATVGAGACYYDTTVSKPVFSDGTTWRDALGTAV